MPEDKAIDAEMLSEMLPIYYNRLFPFTPFYRWLSYGNVDSRLFTNREFSFTLHDDIYIRYQAFINQHELEEAIKKKMPYKIDIGAVYSIPPSSNRQINSSPQPLQRELVFDIDLTDYDEVRTCCSGADVCLKCWRYMSIACKVLDAALRVDFGFNHILWVFSGRRGIHCWVCDETARVLDGPERGAVAEYLQLITGGDDRAKKVQLPNSDNIHSSVRRAVDIIEEHFVSLCIDDQGLLDNAASIKKFLAIFSDEHLRNRVQNIIDQRVSSADKWEAIKAELTNKSSDGYRRRKHLYEEIVIQYAYPRLDINVTKGMNHLLKSPFCIHPKTGKVCVPFSARTAEKFDPTIVPTLPILIEEVNQYDAELNKQLEGEADSKRSRIKDYKKTAMNKSMMIFEEFVRNLEDTWKGKHMKIAKSDEKMDF